jgi:hypothetical protein
VKKDKKRAILSQVFVPIKTNGRIAKNYPFANKP